MSLTMFLTYELFFALTLFAPSALSVFGTSTVQFGYRERSELIYEYDSEGNPLRLRGFQDRANKDFVLGGIFPVHFEAANSAGSKCGNLRVEGGLERVEAMLYAIDLLNSDSDLLPNLTMGYDIRDTCYSETFGLEEAVDLIRPDAQCSCAENASTATPSLGILGAAASRVSIPVAGLCRLFQVPQISYVSASTPLSDRVLYPYFYRTNIPDDLQAKALISLLIAFGWNHISIVYTSNDYGTSGRNAIKKFADLSGICIDLDVVIGEDYMDQDYMNLALRLNSSAADVIVVWGSNQNGRHVLEHYNNIDNPRMVTWIPSAAWSQAESVFEDFSRITVGRVFGAAPSTHDVPGFLDYFSQLTIETNKRDPWFEEYFKAFTECGHEPAAACLNNVSISDVHDYQQEYTVQRVIDAVYAFAHALQNFLTDNCESPLTWYRENQTCKGQIKQLDGPNLLEYIDRLDFVSPTNTRIQFNEFGYVMNGSYELLNFQVLENSDGDQVYDIKEIGQWFSNDTFGNNSDNNMGYIEFFSDRVMPQFGVNENGEVIETRHVPQCGNCMPGTYHRQVPQSCCGICEPCKGEFYSNQTGADECNNCGNFGYYWGINPLNGSDGCVKIPEMYLRFSHPLVIVVVVIAILGLLVVTAVSFILAYYWKTPVITSAGREQLILLLFAIGLIYVLAFFYIAPPILAMCIIQRILLWFCFSLMFGALMVKIIRVGRIFLRRGSITKTKFTHPKYQVLFTFCVVVVQMLIVLISNVFKYPAVHQEIRLNPENVNLLPTVVVTCDQEHLAFLVLAMSYLSAILITTTVLGIVSFKYPKNFNEAKHVCMCTFAVGVIWLAFIACYFTTSLVPEFRSPIIALTAMMNGTTVLACIFSPRIFIIFAHPDKNVTSSISTEKPQNGAALDPIKSNYANPDQKSNVSTLERK